MTITESNQVGGSAVGVGCWYFGAGIALAQKLLLMRIADLTHYQLPPDQAQYRAG